MSQATLSYALLFKESGFDHNAQEGILVVYGNTIQDFLAEGVALLQHLYGPKVDMVIGVRKESQSSPP